MKKCGRQEDRRKKEHTRKRKVTDEVEKGKEGEEKQRTLKLKTQKTEELLCCHWELGS